MLWRSMLDVFVRRYLEQPLKSFMADYDLLRKILRGVYRDAYQKTLSVSPKWLSAGASNFVGKVLTGLQRNRKVKIIKKFHKIPRYSVPTSYRNTSGPYVNNTVNPYKVIQSNRWTTTQEFSKLKTLRLGDKTRLAFTRSGDQRRRYATFRRYLLQNRKKMHSAYIRKKYGTR